MSLAEMRKELREMRKESVKPVSRMKKGDIAHELEAMREKRETTPHIAATPSSKVQKMAPKVANVKKSKEAEHPVAPAKAEKAKMVEKAPKKKMSKAQMREMLEMLSSDEE